MNWNVVNLSECCVSISDGDHLPPPKSDSGVPFITISNVKNNSIDFSNTMFVPQDYYDKIDPKRKAKSGDILYSVVGSFGIPIFIKEDIPFVFQRHIAILRPNSKIIPIFLYYTMLNKSFYKQADSYAIGSAQRTISLTSLRKMKIELPPVPVQKEISSVLSAYDDLIENNNKRIKLLEQMAENLYKEWFVRFRFPGYENLEHKNSVLGSIPKNFNVAKMGDVIEYYIGGGWGNDNETSEYSEEAYVIRGTDFPRVKSGNLSTCQLRYHKANNYKARKFLAEDIVFEVSGGTQEQPVGRSILISQRKLNRFNNRLICASFCKQIRCDKNKIVPLYMYYWLQYMYETRMLDKFQLQSTGITNFKFEYFLRKGNILIPPINLMDRFENNVRKFHDEIDFLSEQNDNLIRQRDLLLPRLMSGKLEV